MLRGPAEPAKWEIARPSQNFLEWVLDPSRQPGPNPTVPIPLHVLSRVQDTTVSTHGACWPGPGGQHILQPSACDYFFLTTYTVETLASSQSISSHRRSALSPAVLVQPTPNRAAPGTTTTGWTTEGSGRDAQPLYLGADGGRNVGESWEQQGGNLYCSPTASGPAAANATQFMQRNLERGTGGDAPAESSSSMMGCCQLEPETLSLSRTHTHTKLPSEPRHSLISTNDDQVRSCDVKGRRHLHHHPTRASIGPGSQSLELPDKTLEPI